MASHFQWKEHFRDPLQWCDNGNSMSNPRVPAVLKHRTTKERLCISFCLNIFWIQGDLTGHGQQQQKFRAQKRKRTMHEAQDGEEVSNFSNRHVRLFQEDTAALVAVLKDCANRQDLCKGTRIHADICRRGLLRTDIFVGTALVNMYAKCGALLNAQEVFDELPVQDVVSWNALIAGYTQHGHGYEALNCFDLMQQQGLSPNVVTFICTLKACGRIGASEKGEEIHAEVVKQRLLNNNSVLGTALVDMYGKCGALAKAQQVFDELPVQSVVSWSALIAGYAQHGHGDEALNCYERMHQQGLYPNAITFTCILNACGSIGAADKGDEIHAEVVRQGILGKNTILGTALVDMYAKCGALAKAQLVFNKLSVQDVVAWNALIVGYAEHGHGHEALDCFERMQHEGFFPNAVTLICTLKACGSIGAAAKSEDVHAEIVRWGLLGTNTTLGTALVDTYAKCGELTKAQIVFCELHVKDVVSWNALVAGYAQQGHACEALNCFELMQYEGFFPNAVTYICILKACSSIGAAKKGEEIHAEVVRQGLLGKDTILGTALVDMFAKCGVVTKAEEVFNELPLRNVISWNALIAGYAQLGVVEAVFSSLKKLMGEGVEPNSVTFTVLLNACSHSGLVNEGQMYFITMSSSYGINPTVEHLTCMVDLFSRAGHFNQAIGLIENLPLDDCSDDLPLWSALLGACRKWGYVKIGKLAFEHVVQLDAKDAAGYVCMNNIYAAARMQEAAGKVEPMTVKNMA